MNSEELARTLGVSHETVCWAIRSISDKMNFGRHLVSYDFHMIDEERYRFDDICEPLQFAVAVRINAVHKFSRSYLNDLFLKPKDGLT